MKLTDIMQEYGKAGRRIQAERGKFGGSHAAAMGWLLAFAQEDLSQLGDGGLTDRGWEVFRFANDAGVGGGPLAGLKLAWSGADSDLERLKAIQTRVQRIMTQYEKIQTVASSSLSFRPKVSFSLSGGPSPHLGVHAESIGDAVEYHVMHLLVRFGPRLRRCGGCRRRFLAGRTDKKWCSGICQATVWKREHPTKIKRGKKGGRRGKK